MGVQKRSTEAAGRARPSKSGGEGKKKKVFSESLGKEHMIELSNSIAGSHSTKLKERVDKAKEKAKWQKEKRVQKMKSKTGSEEKGGSVTSDLKGRKMPMSKSSIRASLLAKQREKTRRRKEVRKAAASTLISSHNQTASSTTDGLQKPNVDKPTRKRVSFA